MYLNEQLVGRTVDDREGVEGDDVKLLGHCLQRGNRGKHDGWKFMFRAASAGGPQAPVKCALTRRHTVGPQNQVMIVVGNCPLPSKNFRFFGPAVELGVGSGMMGVASFSGNDYCNE